MSPVPKRALLSVHDKTGIADLARGLVEAGWELVSSGGTASVLADEGVPVVEVGEGTGAPEILEGRVKTLHPAIHGGILADRSNPGHLADLEARGIVPIDLVVGNLYPFTSDPGIELIDIGGPTMVRAAAKNYAYVGVVVDPADYRPVLDELRAVGSLSDATRRRLADQPSPTQRPTTRPSWPGSMRTHRRTMPTTCSSRPCIWPWTGSMTSGTARTRTRWVPATGLPAPPDGGTPPWCTVGRPCHI